MRMSIMEYLMFAILFRFVVSDFLVKRCFRIVSKGYAYYFLLAT